MNGAIKENISQHATGKMNQIPCLDRISCFSRTKKNRLDHLTSAQTFITSTYHATYTRSHFYPYPRVLHW